MPDKSTFEGAPIDVIDVKLRGNAGVDQLNQILHLGDEVLFVGRASLSRVQHQRSEKRGLVRIQTAEVIEAHILTGDDAAAADVETLLLEARSARDAALDKLLGRAPLPFDAATGEIAPTEDPAPEPGAEPDDYEQKLRDDIEKPNPPRD